MPWIDVAQPCSHTYLGCTYIPSSSQLQQAAHSAGPHTALPGHRVLLRPRVAGCQKRLKPNVVSAQHGLSPSGTPPPCNGLVTSRAEGFGPEHSYSCALKHSRFRPSSTLIDPTSRCPDGPPADRANRTRPGSRLPTVRGRSLFPLLGGGAPLSRRGLPRFARSVCALCAVRLPLRRIKCRRYRRQCRQKWSILTSLKKVLRASCFVLFLCDFDTGSVAAGTCDWAGAVRLRV